MKKYLNYIIGGGVLVAVLLIAFFLKNRPNNISIDRDTNSDVSKQSASTTETAAKNAQIAPKVAEIKPKATVTPKPVVSKPAPQSYTDAVEKYKNSGYYIQFYPCQASPGSLIVKQGSKIMLDNRDSKAHSIGIKSDKYLIASYSYAIATLNVIGTNYVTCDGGGSGTVTVVP